MTIQQIASEYQKYATSSAFAALARAAHGDDYVGQTSSATCGQLALQLQRAQLRDDALVLDAGCGNGCFSLFIANEFNCRVIGVDIAEPLIETARLAAANLHAACQFRVRDFRNIDDFAGQADVVLSVGSLYWEVPIQQTLESWRRCLAPGGHLLIYLNVAVKDLSEQEQLAVGNTVFVSRQELEHHLNSLCVCLDASDETEGYLEWLTRWNDAMADNRSRLTHELGGDRGQALEVRFATYAKLARNRTVLRMVYRGHVA